MATYICGIVVGVVFYILSTLLLANAVIVHVFFLITIQHKLSITIIKTRCRLIMPAGYEQYRPLIRTLHNQRVIKLITPYRPFPGSKRVTLLLSILYSCYVLAYYKLLIMFINKQSLLLEEVETVFLDVIDIKILA